MPKILAKQFYNNKTLKVAQDLLGCFLVILPNSKSPAIPPLARSGRAHANKNAKIKYKIIETEAYCGPNDLASHASRGRTDRNKVMFGGPGIIYIYLVYGMHYMLNIVTEKENYPAAVLIRGVELVDNLVNKKLDGPAKLTKTLKIDKKFNGLPIYTKKHGLWIEGREKDLKPSQIKKVKRVGIDYAKEYKDKLWRFIIKSY